ncbi:tripartite tricarboxylate transporter substrate binding protein [Ramlibacter sp. G-1-2-2]|uniref:Tripartite tricarboxylate transporter substrate binding protein n=1 Tax=Ramlibacter agri TaxID=2728837 RepID=A0A848H6U7_9BURK|nr:tripartite tricarboxylate transporter substrate binding protein [Ramlibacter agri]NML46217.1 tripartite tricarboxylate transporter substrate binding protein [Ramlibacter agri]
MHCATRRGLLAASLALAAGAALPAGAAEAWPARPITLVVPQGPGSGSDISARLIAQFMATELGQPVVVDNRAGAGGIVAHQAVMRAPADGYTLLFTSTAQLLVVPEINPSARYTLDDFTPVAPVLRAPFAILVAATPGSPRTLNELVERLRATPAAFASAGVGTMTHLASEIFLNRAGVKATHVPYKGSGAALADLMGGQVLFAADSLTASLPFVRSGKLRALAVTGDQREGSLPEVPTLAEAGLPGDPVAVIGGLFAPKGIPKDVAARIGHAADVALRKPEVVARFAAMETGILHVSNDAFVAQLRREAPGWQALVRKMGIKAE